ncbi:MAG: glutamate-1-semialdehyde 2,1-aminomutase [Bacteriovoracaceae bacterium]|nr:glutamate-1-semialdehyde 2,1-aminomutase [Bacteriovoracaceae bacterium]
MSNMKNLNGNDSSELLFERSKKVVPGGVHSPVRSFKGLDMSPRFISRAEGAYLWDESGKNYIDFCMSFGPLILGHQHPEVKRVIIDALDRGWSFGACEKYSLALAEFIVKKIPFIDQIRFVNSGTEAVMAAIRIAKGYTKREKILKFEGCYHGHLDSMLIKSGSGLAGEGESTSAGVGAESISNTLVCPLGDEEKLRFLFETQGQEIAAIILEPLPANYGLLKQNINFIKFLRTLCDQYQSLLIFDEVISGFRIAFGGMAEVTNIVPDIITYGKVIGGGMPVGAIAGKKHIMEMLAPVGPVYQAGTLSANPVAMSAGLKQLEILAEPGFYQNLEALSKKIENMWVRFFEQHRDKFSPSHVIREGSLFWFAPSLDQSGNSLPRPSNTSHFSTSIMSSFYPLFHFLLERGVYLAPNAYEVGFVSTAHANVLEELSLRLGIESE